MKPKISIVVAMAKNRAIGKNGQLLWHISRDLKHFKSVTSGKCVIMGHNTYVSLPGQKALPNRRNIIISDRLDNAPDGFELATSIQKALKLVENEAEVFIMGGGMIYEQFLGMAETLYLTRVDKDFEADTYFPIINFEEWELNDLEVIDDDPQVDYSYRFETWDKKK
ncbi:MAG: dihydrofolate reductase [Lentimicrobiaceae bacterium]|nr:dihydrofolate reductase [Lentimicrobiaceae bacterium]